MARCAWCGQEFTQTHGNQKYCSQEHRKKAEREQGRNRFHKWYMKHRDTINQQRIRGVGTGSLGKSRRCDFADELRVIEKEMARLKI